MSWEKKPDGRYLVRWRDSAGRSRSKTVYRQRDAIALDGEMKRKRSMGELLDHERGDQTLADFWELYWTNYAQVHLSPRTRENYEIQWRCHIKPKLGRHKLRTIRREDVSKLLQGLSGQLQPATVGKVHTVLQGVLRLAVEWGYISHNPAARMKQTRANKREGRALTPEQIEALCRELPDLRDCTIVRLLAFTGLRPGELRGLRWHDVGERALQIERSVSANRVGPTKTRRSRSVELQPAARKTLLEWYMACGQPAADAYVIPGARSQVSFWTDDGYSKWGQKVFVPAATRAGLKGLVPYDLRHTFISALVAEGRDLYWLARQTGHNPAVMLERYAHLVGGESVASECHANASVYDILSGNA